MSILSAYSLSEAETETLEEKSPLRRIGESPLVAINKRRVPNRPLGEFSDYIVDCLPSLVNQGLLEQESINLRTEMVYIRSLIFDCIPNDPEKIPSEKRNLALLDLVMMETALSNLSLLYKDVVEVPPELIRSTTFLATKLQMVPTLSYQSVIIDNDPLDPRVFTTGETAEHEWFFYRVHAKIEKHNKSLIEVLLKMASEKDLSAVPIVRIRTVITEFVHSVTTMQELVKHFSKEHFEKFRNFFFGNSERQMPGASGLFSATLSVLDVLLLKEYDLVEDLREGGSQLMPKPTYAKEENYTSTDDLERAKEYRKRFGSLIERNYHSENIEHLKMLSQIIEFLRDFRRKHMGAVSRFTPEVANENGTGTANPKYRSSKFILEKIIEKTETSLDYVNERIKQIEKKD